MAAWLVPYRLSIPIPVPATRFHTVCRIVMSSRKLKEILAYTNNIVTSVALDSIINTETPLFLNA